MADSLHVESERVSEDGLLTARLGATIKVKSKDGIYVRESEDEQAPDS
jgi:hypothetical protein